MVAAKRVPILVLLAALIGLPRSAGAALIFEAIPSPILDYDPSVRSVSMGGASGAVLWGDAPNYWANPALLGYAEGIRYEDELQHLPTLDIGIGGETLIMDSRAMARREVIGYGGLGIALAGRPFDGPGGIRFVTKVTDMIPGSPTSTDEFSDDVWSWSAGISASRLVQSFAALSRRKPPGFTRHVDLAAGYTHKSTGTTGQAVSHDWGLLARGGAPLQLRAATLRFEGAYGYSVLNAPGSSFLATYRRHRNDLAARAAIEAPKPLTRLPGWLREGFQPLLSIGGAWQAEHLFYAFSVDTFFSSTDQTSRAWGGELTLMNVVSLRMGRDRSHQTSTGWGLSLPIGRFASFRYDRSRLDNDFAPVLRSWSVWVDPVAMIRARR